jgi:hypothetical protein
MKLKYVVYKLNLVILLAFVLTACGGGSGGGEPGSGRTTATATAPSDQAAEESTILHGSVGDGPIIGATINVYDKNGNLLAEQSSDTTAKYELTVRTSGNAYPLILEAVNGTDVVTGQTPDFTLKSIVQTPGKKKRANINPFSTMIVEVALTMPGGLTAENVDAARQVVLSQLNFGFDASLMSDPISSVIDESNIAVIIKSSETFGEMLRRSRDALQATSPGISADQIVANLAADLSDGVLDGLGATAAEPRVAAVATIASAQVLIEAMTGQLKVNNTDATAAMNDAVMLSQSGMQTNVNTVPVVSEMLGQSRIALTAAQNVDANPLLVTTVDALTNLQAGTEPGAIVDLLPADVDVALTTTLTNTLQASDAELEQVNATVRNGGDPIVVVNTPPTISGLPQAMVEQDTAYSFTPEASDVDGDVLMFTVSNLPQWAEFDAATGTLSGVPGSNDVGIFNGVSIAVSDGVASATLPTFSIEVSAAPNFPPSIGGMPASSVVENTAYRFVPMASDDDGDTLSFSISNRPLWASFDPATGTLSGTPTSSDVGVTSGIVISVTDGVDSVSLPPFYISVTTVPNTAPVISGTPQYSVLENTAYSFVPSASDADGDALSFSVVNLPQWASFNAANGAISGIPGNANVGVYSGIVITVSDGKESVSLAPFSIEVTGTENNIPVISGSPSTSVEENTAYSFAPTASDADGDTLSFSVTNLPVWASFNASTGAISGTPSTVDVGVTANIVITVSDGTASVALPAFDITVVAATTTVGTATLSWLPPTENTDGTVLTDLAGFKIYYGTQAGNYTDVITINNAGITSYVVENLPAGNTYYFVVTAVTSSGVESGYSVVGSKTIF